MSAGGEDDLDFSDGEEEKPGDSLGTPGDAGRTLVPSQTRPRRKDAKPSISGRKKRGAGEE